MAHKEGEAYVMSAERSSFDTLFNAQLEGNEKRASDSFGVRQCHKMSELLKI
jgi:hypothetical protein